MERLLYSRYSVIKIYHNVFICDQTYKRNQQIIDIMQTLAYTYIYIWVSVAQTSHNANTVLQCTTSCHDSCLLIGVCLDTC